jgi:uncharacterized protein (TIGR02145 family)
MILGLSTNRYNYLLVFCLLFVSCKKTEDSVTELADNLLVLRTDQAVDIIGNSALGEGYIKVNGSSSVTSIGFCWSTSSDPTIDRSYSINYTSSNSGSYSTGSSFGSFSCPIAGLSPGKTYYVRSYATVRLSGNYNSFTAYGNQIEFTTSDSELPTISTKAVSSITGTGASSGGVISNDGGKTITAKGVCWSTSPNPTIALSTKTSNGTGTGSFTSNLNNLIPITQYYVRAYATNSAGTGYGEELTFTTGVSSNPVDADGNTYTTVTIGTQVWMKENLKVTKYRNGNVIPTNLTNTAWQATTGGAYSIHGNISANNTTYGKLYNWYAVADSRNLCPVGWHVPTDIEWTTLENYLGGADVAGGKLKSNSSLWTAPNSGVTNESGFSGLPGGARGWNGTYNDIGYYGYWWSTTEASNSSAFYRYLGYYDINSSKDSYYKQVGFSVRCLKD